MPKGLLRGRTLVAGSVVLDLSAMSLAFGGHGMYGAMPTHASTVNPLLGSTCADLVALLTSILCSNIRILHGQLKFGMFKC